MQRSEKRILTTHTGSLPRPPELTGMYARRARGEAVDSGAIEHASEQALKEIIQAQVDAGVDIVNDGEQQRESFVMHLRHRLSGLGGEGSRLGLADIARYPEFQMTLKRDAIDKESVSNRAFIPKAIGAVEYIDSSHVQKECAALMSALRGIKTPAVGCFFTAPSPGIVSTVIQNEFYPTQDAYIEALSAALKKEYEIIVASGFILQIDCPDLAMERHGAFQHQTMEDYLHFSDLVVEAINGALENIPSDRVRAHVCWGNYEGPHDCDVALHEILPTIQRLKVGGLVLPFANPRHAHEVRVLREFPLRSDQVIIAGVIDSVTNVIEHPEVVADRIERVADALGDPTRIIAGTDCGFDTAAGMGRVARDVVWAKLKTMAEGAEIASRRLF